MAGLAGPPTTALQNASFPPKLVFIINCARYRIIMKSVKIRRQSATVEWRAGAAQHTCQSEVGAANRAQGARRRDQAVIDICLRSAAPGQPGVIADCRRVRWDDEIRFVAQISERLAVHRTHVLIALQLCSRRVRVFIDRRAVIAGNWFTVYRVELASVNQRPFRFGTVIALRGQIYLPELWSGRSRKSRYSSVNLFIVVLLLFHNNCV